MSKKVNKKQRAARQSTAATPTPPAQPTAAPEAAKPEASKPKRRAAAEQTTPTVVTPVITPVHEALYKLSIGQIAKDTKGDGKAIKIGGAGTKDTKLASDVFAILVAHGYVELRHDLASGQTVPNEYTVSPKGMDHMVAGKVETDEEPGAE